MLKYSHLRFCLYVLTLAVIFQCVQVGVDGAPGRKSRGKSSRGGSSIFSTNKNNGWSSNAGRKRGSMKTLKKAAVIGAVAYGGYQIGKLTGRFSSWGGYHQRGWGFHDWNKWREIDGFMCRDNNDCNWIDPRLYCQDYEIDFRPSALWFGGDAARIIGECACPRDMVWDDYELECESNLFLGLTTTILTVVIVLAVIFIFCCCICSFLICRRFF